MSAPTAWREKPALWTSRARIAADWASDFGSVADIGCGTGIRALLPAWVDYVASDVYARDADTIVLDLNAERMPDFGTHGAVLLGVMPYLDDPADILDQLRQFDRVVVSYNVWTLKETLFPGARRWRNRMTAGRFRRMIRAAGFRIERDKRIGWSERLFLIVREDRT